MAIDRGTKATSRVGRLIVDTTVQVGDVMRLMPQAFTSLPGTPREGMMAWVNDSNTATWGATVAGGGANKALVVYNGTNWTCAGK